MTESRLVTECSCRFQGRISGRVPTWNAKFSICRVMATSGSTNGHSSRGRDGMTQILAFIVTYMAYLWDGARFRLVDSEVTTANGGDALLIVESITVRLRFVRDRGQLFLDLQPTAVPADE